MRRLLWTAALLSGAVCLPAWAQLYPPGALPQKPLTGGTISVGNTYQQVAASCPGGGLIENTSAVGTAALYADWTAGISAGGTSLGNGAAAIGAPLVSGQAGGKQVIPPTINPIFVYGPAGATFRGSC